MPTIEVNGKSYETDEEGYLVNLADWKTRGANALVIGSVRRLADGRYDVRFRLLDTVQQAQLEQVQRQQVPPPSKTLRAGAECRAGWR